MPSTTAVHEPEHDADLAAPLARGTCVGRYVVIERIGGGATSEVYAAFDPELARRVALKVLTRAPGEAGEAQWRRLRREAQALAQLSHEHVVSVYDVGIAALPGGDVRVYLGMQLVEGTDLAAWLRSRPRPRSPREVREIVDVFARAGRGLTAAHAVGLVHRDFKPGNVLIGHDGSVRVADFGLARSPTTPQPAPAEVTPAPEGSSALLAVAMTEPGVIAGTPPYMAPEQFLGESIDARTDQFAFCAALHEALYGERAFAGATFAAVRRAITRGDVRPAPAGARIPARLRKIVLRGLSPRPADRFPSMSALVTELTRDSRARVRRALPAVSGLVAATALAVIAVTRGDPARASPCRHAADRLEGVWDDARRAELQHAFGATRLPRADDVARRLTARLDAHFNQWVAAHADACEATHVRHEQSTATLDLRMHCLDRRLAEARALVTVFVDAPDRQLLDGALDAAARLSGPRTCSDADALRTVVPAPTEPTARARVATLAARLDELEAMRDAGRHERALPLARAVAAEAGEVAHAPLTARALAVRASLEEHVGAYAAAEASYYAAARAAGAARDDARMAQVLTELVLVVGDRRREPERAGAIAEIAAAVVARAGDDPEASAELLDSQGHVLNSQGRYEEAATHYARALEVRRQTLGGDDPRLAWSLNNLATARYNQGLLKDAHRHYDEALALDERVLGPAHPHVAVLLGNLGHLLRRLGRLDEAQAHHERALALRREALGPRHTLVANSLHGLGRIAADRGDLVAARGYFERALEIDEGALGLEHADLAVYLSDLADVLQALGELDRALSLYGRALALGERTLGHDHPAVAAPLTGLSQLYLRLGQPEDARDAGERAVGALAAHDSSSSELATARFTLARALWELGRERTRARHLALQACDGLRAAAPAAARELGEVERWLTER